MTLSLSLLLYIFYAFLALWALFFAIGIYHLLKYGFRSIMTLASFVIFITVASLILSVTFGYIATVDWDEPLDLTIQTPSSDQDDVLVN